MSQVSTGPLFQLHLSVVTTDPGPARDLLRGLGGVGVDEEGA